MLATKGMGFPIDVILVCIRWYAAYPLGYHHLEEMMQERGVFVDHSSINRWAIRFLPLFEKVFRKYKRPAGGNWRMDETYILVKGVWKYLYRAVDKQGKTVDFLLTAKRDKAAAMRFFDKAMQTNGVPEKVTMDKSGANKAAMDAINASSEIPITVRQVKYLNNIVEQDHRAVKRVTKPMLNFKSFQSAKCVLAGIELMHMNSKRSVHDAGLLRDVVCRPVLCFGRTNPSSLRNRLRSHQKHVRQPATRQNRRNCLLHTGHRNPDSDVGNVTSISMTQHPNPTRGRR